MSEIVCPSLRASNPICLMAAVGLLRTCHRLLPALGKPRLSWRWEEPEWRAVLHTEGRATPDDLLDCLSGLRFPEPRDEFEWRDEVKGLTREQFRRRATDIKGDTYLLEWLAALAAESLTRSKDKLVTPFDTTAGRWILLKRFRTIHALLFPGEPQQAETRAKFRAALFEEWTYGDEQISFNWDPALVNQGAYCPLDPADKARSPNECVLAAVWLAIECLPMFPCDSTAGRLRTRGFFTGRGSWLSWPVWTEPVTLSTLKSLLAMPEVTSAEPPLACLRQRGIVVVYRSRRWNPTNYAAFSFGTPSALRSLGR